LNFARGTNIIDCQTFRLDINGANGRKEACWESDQMDFPPASVLAQPSGLRSHVVESIPQDA
jgi:hypothetical protein